MIASGVDPEPASTYDVAMPVWGAEFIDLLLNVCVPNQLLAGNLPALPPGSRYRIFTRTSDVDALATSPRLEAVRRMLPVDVVGVLDSDGQAGTQPIRTRYRMMTACQRRAVADAATRRAALMFLSPDFVLAEGTIAALVRIHSTGKRAVLSANLRLDREAFASALATRGAGVGLAPRELVRLAFGCLHPSTQSLMVDSPHTNTSPEMVLWPLRSGSGALEGLLVRTFGLHPVLLDPVRRHELPRATADGHHLMRTGIKLKQCHVVQDSDEIAIFELTPANRVIGTREGGGGLSLPRLAAVASRCDRYQASHWQRTIRLHTGDLDQRWVSLEAASARVGRELERYRRYGPVLFQTYRLLHIWRQRRDAWLRSVRRTVRPHVTAKQVLRPVRIGMHRVAKAARVRFKRVRRLVGVWQSRTIA